MRTIIYCMEVFSTETFWKIFLYGIRISVVGCKVYSLRLKIWNLSRKGGFWTTDNPMCNPHFVFPYILVLWLLAWYLLKSLSEKKTPTNKIIPIRNEKVNSVSKNNGDNALERLSQRQRRHLSRALFVHSYQCIRWPWQQVINPLGETLAKIPMVWNQRRNPSSALK